MIGVPQGPHVRGCGTIFLPMAIRESIDKNGDSGDEGLDQTAAIQPRPKVRDYLPRAESVEEVDSEGNALGGPVNSPASVVRSHGRVFREAVNHNLAATRNASIPRSAHHTRSSPCWWSSRWWTEHRGTVNSSETFRPSAVGPAVRHPHHNRGSGTRPTKPSEGT